VLSALAHLANLSGPLPNAALVVGAVLTVRDLVHKYAPRRRRLLRRERPALDPFGNHLRQGQVSGETGPPIVAPRK
jgi:hypothetical protein